MPIVLFFFPFSAETSFISAPLPCTFLTSPSPFPLSFLPSSSSKFWDFSALLGLGQKHKKGVFGSGPAVHKGHLFVLGLGQEILPGLSHGGSFKETSVFSGRPRRLRARPPLSMGEMQGALARARLESLLRPRHKKRAEAQKRSESFLLTGLGKRRRGPRGPVPPRRVCWSSSARGCCW